MPTVASPKRGKAERGGTHAWFPYYAGFSEAFVRDAVHYLGATQDTIVLDPMNGSGTTTVAAQGQGIISVGIDLNPVMVTFARAKNAAFVGRGDELHMLVDEVVESARSIEGLTDPVTSSSLRWFSEDLLAALRTLSIAIDRSHASSISSDGRFNGVLDARILERNEASLKDLLRAALLRVVRRTTQPRTSKNPTWFKPGPKSIDDGSSVFNTFKTLAIEMQQDLQATFTAAEREPSLTAVVPADARDLPLATAAIDCIITSPPYLTRIDYAVSTAPELVFLGYDSEEAFRDLRASIMGSTCIAPRSIEINPRWGETCEAILDKIRNHPSKASSTYYLKSHQQYFADAQRFVREMLRVMRPGGRALLVVQESWYKDVHVPLGKIYLEMAANLGAACAAVIKDQEVRAHLGHVNTRARRYEKGSISEQVVMIEAA